MPQDRIVFTDLEVPLNGEDQRKIQPLLEGLDYSDAEALYMVSFMFPNLGRILLVPLAVSLGMCRYRAINGGGAHYLARFIADKWKPEMGHWVLQGRDSWWSGCTQKIAVRAKVEPKVEPKEGDKKTPEEWLRGYRRRRSVVVRRVMGSRRKIRL